MPIGGRAARVRAAIAGWCGRWLIQRGWHTWSMTPWRIRDFHEDDLDAAVRLWDDPAAGTAAPVFGVSDLISAVRMGAPAVVAVVGDDLVGTVVVDISGARAWCMRIR